MVIVRTFMTNKISNFWETIKLCLIIKGYLENSDIILIGSEEIFAKDRIVIKRFSVLSGLHIFSVIFSEILVQRERRTLCKLKSFSSTK